MELGVNKPLKLDKPLKLARELELSDCTLECHKVVNFIRSLVLYTLIRPSVTYCLIIPMNRHFIYFITMGSFGSKISILKLG